ncbi:MAG: methylenetetrahydrofolate--tRNA-(uracil(54)-C(5))-methyltransferase (FADH(2)-oxidizing) TrmFO [Deltaproteobacteria bacterium]|nr:methylenetetrahydrofolate--tRNA-(uracil(54)-C(5))-methyltransferase (FADH(2)-oxidizing) TrmFO [Deltaproteobacteria bacterium]
MKPVVVVGGGLAGCEAAWQLASRGIEVVLREQKPIARTPAQVTDHLCELVCSNSFRGAAITNAVGLLKEEMRRMGSLIMACADETAVPAGGALAVDRERFSAAVTSRLDAHPLISRESVVVDQIPNGFAIIATGPLTADALAQALVERVGSEHMAYYDAISPVVSADSIQWDKVFKASRYDKGDDDAYVNCPMNREQYAAFVEAVVGSKKVPARSFEEIRYFEGCLPIEVMAERGVDTLRYGPMKPVGLTDPKTGRWPYACVQLRLEDVAGTAYNIVGFQTRMTWPEQARVLAMIPGLETAEYLRFGSVHRNTFVHAPKLLTPWLELKSAPGVYLAGQITGVEGYLESAASGLMAGLFLSQRIHDESFDPPPATTALGALLRHLWTDRKDFQPSNVNWSMVPPLEGLTRKVAKRDKYELYAARALEDLAPWTQRQRVEATSV